MADEATYSIENFHWSSLRYRCSRIPPEHTLHCNRFQWQISEIMVMYDWRMCAHYDHIKWCNPLIEVLESWQSFIIWQRLWWDCCIRYRQRTPDWNHPKLLDKSYLVYGYQLGRPNASSRYWRRYNWTLQFLEDISADRKGLGYTRWNGPFPWSYISQEYLSKLHKAFQNEIKWSSSH
jgi:hypothetical protein